MFASIALLGLALVPGPDTRHPGPSLYRPRVELWTNNGDDVYTRGQAVRVSFRADQDAFITVLRVDTDGRIRVLFPREPWEDNFARGGREYEVLGGGTRDAFRIDDYPGVGYVFAVAAADPFIYDAIESGDHWDYRAISDGRIRGDPYVALTELVERIVPRDYGDWDYDLVPYHVERHYDYPRFLCYDCHSYVSWPYWDPYYYSCVRFRIVIFDDPYYYPYRYYGGTRVVFVRPYRPEPRFIFKDRGASDQFVTRVRQRPVNDDLRRGVRGRDLGVAIPPPREEHRRDRPARPDEPRDDDRGRRRERPERPEHPDRPDRPDQPNRPDRPERPVNPNTPDRPQRPDRPERPERPGRPERAERPDRRERPDRAEPRAEPRSEPRTTASRPPARAEPSREPRTEPRSAARPEPKSQPRPAAEPKRDAPRAGGGGKSGDKPKRSEPELRRRKP